MNPSSLLALVVDQHAGELNGEVAELLEAFLAGNAPARAEAERIRQTLALTEQTVLRHADLARVAGTDSSAPHASAAKRRAAPAWLARAAAVALLAGVTGAGGYFAGRTQSAPLVVAAATSETATRPARKDSPWARYRFAPDGGGGGMQIVRVEAQSAGEVLR